MARSTEFFKPEYGIAQSLNFSGRKGLMPRLLSFYKCYRAYVRGKVESFKLDDPHISEEEKTGVLVAAKSYFELTESYTIPGKF